MRTRTSRNSTKVGDDDGERDDQLNENCKAEQQEDEYRRNPRVFAILTDHDTVDGWFFHLGLHESPPRLKLLLHFSRTLYRTPCRARVIWVVGVGTGVLTPCPACALYAVSVGMCVFTHFFARVCFCVMGVGA